MVSACDAMDINYCIIYRGTATYAEKRQIPIYVKIQFFSYVAQHGSRNPDHTLAPNCIKRLKPLIHASPLPRADSLHVQCARIYMQGKRINF